MFSHLIIPNVLMNDSHFSLYFVFFKELHMRHSNRITKYLRNEYLQVSFRWKFDDAGLCLFNKQIGKQLITKDKKHLFDNLNPLSAQRSILFNQIKRAGKTFN